MNTTLIHAPWKSPSSGGRIESASFTARTARQLGHFIQFMPLMRDAPHQQRGIKLHRASRKPGRVGEKPGLNLLDLQWGHLPAVRLQLYSLEFVPSQGTGKPAIATLKERLC